MAANQDEWIEFLRLLRRIAIEIARWIERRHPEVVS